MRNSLSKSGTNISLNDEPVISEVWFEGRNIFVRFSDGKTAEKPVDLYPNLRKGTPEQWLKYELWNGGRWIHWEELDEDLSAMGFLK